MSVEKIIVDSVNQMKNGIIDDVLHKTQQIIPSVEEIKSHKSKDCDEKNVGSVNVINAFSRNKRLTIMVVGAASGLIFCLLVLTTYKNDLPGEVVGIVSTVAGIFGACLKDTYSCEFSSNRKKDVQQLITDKLKY